MALSGGYNRLRLLVNPDGVDDFLVHVADGTGGEVEVEAVAPASKGAVLYFEADEVDGVDETARRRGVSLEEGGHGYEASVRETGFLGHAGEVGGRVARYSDTSSGVEVEIDIPTDVDAQEFVEGVEEMGYDTEFVAKTSHSVSPEGSSMEGLTEKQAEVLRSAYINGFFDWPKETDGNELAESLGIARSTLHQHLRAAERKLVEDAVDENPVR